MMHQIRRFLSHFTILSEYFISKWNLYVNWNISNWVNVERRLNLLRKSVYTTSIHEAVSLMSKTVDRNIIIWQQCINKWIVLHTRLQWGNNSRRRAAALLKLAGLIYSLVWNTPLLAAIWGERLRTAAAERHTSTSVKSRSFDGFYREWWLKSSLKTEAALVFMFTEYSSDGRRCQRCRSSKIFPWTLEWNVCLCVLILTEQSSFLF